MTEQRDLIYVHYLHSLGNAQNNWKWAIGLGIAFIILGILAIGSSTFATFFSIIFLGVLLAIGGVSQTVYSFWIKKWSGFFLSLLVGIIYTVSGVLCIIHPAVSAIGITLFIGAFCVIAGLFRIIMAPLLRFNQWGWVFFNGVITLILGFLILSGWPLTGLWVIGLFLGIDMLFVGWSWLFLGLAARNYLNKGAKPS